ncbi:MAG: MFS transporter [Erysipelotrichaceae bacterium]|nr:MFS transporter [Erysipelotrichaceae bacterium]MBQ1533461.1 MFS transporter [Erysipelotrichaceae bacterium]MBQ1788245.1 MFS transporter [Erysipelotrichaceae bacterium]MBQ5804358.1 MFS transporter [Erysipelotrichaceae bacterium]
MDRQQVLKTAYRMMLISTVCTLCTHVSYVWSVISAELKVQNGWSNLMASMPYTVGNICAGLSAILAGITSDQKNPGKMALFGAIMVGVGLCILAVFSRSFFLVCLGYGILVECGQNFSNVGLPNAALKWVPSELKGKTAGICTIGTSLSALVISVMFKIYTGSFGFRTGMILLALTLSSIAAFAAAHFRPAPQEVIDMNKNEALNFRVIRTPYENLTLKECLKTRQFLLFNFSWFLVMTANLAVVSQTISIINSFSDVAFPSWIFVAIGGIIGSFGRFFFGAASDRVGVLKMFSMLTVIFGAALLLFPNLHAPFLLFICYALIQFVVAGMNAVIFAALGLIFGTRHNGAISGFNGTGYVFAGILGPTIASIFKDRFNTYYPAFILFGVIQFFAAFVFYRMYLWLEDYNQKQKQ